MISPLIGTYVLVSCMVVMTKVGPPLHSAEITCKIVRPQRDARLPLSVTDLELSPACRTGAPPPHRAQCVIPSRYLGCVLWRGGTPGH